MPRIARALGIALTAACAACAASPGVATGQGYPAADRSIRVIVPFPAGGGVDTTSRVVMEKVAAGLGTPLVVENRVGAGGTIGTSAIAKSPPDGYTFGVITAAQALNPALYRNIPYDLVKDLEPVTLIASANGMLVVTSSLPVRSVAELITYAKARPGKLSYATAGGIGTLPHLAGELFKLMTGTDMHNVPYKGHEMYTDLVAGRVEVSFPTATSTLPFVKSGQLRALAVTGTKRLPALPDVPTMDEAGVKGYRMSSQWYGVVGPRGVPPAIVNRMHQEVARAIAHPDIQKRFANDLLEASGNSPNEFAALMAAEVEQFARIAREINLKLE